jgi:two-component system chemotaxis response regulator CheB
VDPLFESAAATYGPRVGGVVLTGGGHDGVSGLFAIKAAAGLCLTQDPGDAIHPWMPLSAIRFDHVDGVLPLDRIAASLVALAIGDEVYEVSGDGLMPPRDARRSRTRQAASGRG